MSRKQVHKNLPVVYLRPRTKGVMTVKNLKILDVILSETKDLCSKHRFFALKQGLRMTVVLVGLGLPGLLSAQGTMTGIEMGSLTAPVTVKLTLPKAEEMALAGNPHIHAADKRV